MDEMSKDADARVAEAEKEVEAQTSKISEFFDTMSLAFNKLFN